MRDKYKNRVTNFLCPKCGGFVHLEIEPEIDYPFVCLECDENFYAFEVGTSVTEAKQMAVNSLLGTMKI